MLPLRMQGQTRALGAPSDWDADKSGHCSVLSIVDTEVAGHRWMVSRWEPTPDELALLNAGGSVELWICGSAHPVVSLTAAARETD
jgi:hypothetical protein